LIISNSILAAEIHLAFALVLLRCCNYFSTKKPSYCWV